MGGGEDEEDENLVRLYEERVCDFDRWEERKQEIEERSLGRTEDSVNVMEKRFEDAVENSQNHDTLLKSVITPFGPRSEIYGDTEWKLLGVEPLYEQDPHLRNPDTLIGHDDRDIAVSVECKSGLKSPQKAIKQIRDATDVVLNKKQYLSRNADCQFSDIEPVLCVPGELLQKAVKAIERDERQNDRQRPIHLWTIHRFKDDKLQLHTHFSTRTEEESKHNSQLASKLGNGEGVIIGGKTGLTPEFYPDSHIFSVMDNVFSEIIHKRDSSDSSIRKFTREEVKEYINNQKRVPHYDIEAVSEMITSDLIQKMLAFNLIDEVEPESGIDGSVEVYGYDENRVRGQSTSRIISNLKSEFKQEWCERKAEKEAKQQASREFRDENPKLSDWD